MPVERGRIPRGGKQKVEAPWEAPGKNWRTHSMDFVTNAGIGGSRYSNAGTYGETRRTISKQSGESMARLKKRDARAMSLDKRNQKNQNQLLKKGSSPCRPPFLDCP